MLPKFLSFPVIGALLWFNPACAQNNIDSTPATAETLNKVAHIKALIETERAPRSWKTLKLWPGKPKYFYYEWLMPDGTTVVKLENAKIKGVPDHRIFSDKHPNGPIIYESAELAVSFAGNFIANVIIHRL